MQERQKTRILILGVTGMLGSSLYRSFCSDPNLETYGTLRSENNLKYFTEWMHKGLIPDVNIQDEAEILTAICEVRPDVVVNCVGIIKQNERSSDRIENLKINALLPHRLERYAEAYSARLIHFSTDCVFSGNKGQYSEHDFADANDIYGRSKFLGELNNEKTITLRTSIIGHELASSRSLVDWFLSQNDPVKGFKKAIFSGMPTIEISRIIREYVLPSPNLHGLYHLSVDPIDKYSLLKLISKKYNKDISIILDESFVIDRSLNSTRFQNETGYVPLPWPVLIDSMHKEYNEYHKKFR